MDSHLSRREVIRTAAAVAATGVAGAAAHAAPTGRKPNVILIMLDDLGSVDANCYGSNDLTTPNLDSIAVSGTRFTQCCAAAPLCSPSRAGVLTGRYPQRAGMASNASSKPGGPGMSPDEVTLAQVFKNAGYATGHVGKWHLGYSPQTIPTAKGFDSSFGHMGGCIDNYSHFFYWDGPDRHDLWENGNEVWRDGRNIGDLMVEQCLAFIEKNKDRPFFLFWPINQPHYPLQGRAKWRKHYEQLPSPRNMYAASVSTLDELIGAVLTRVRDLGLEQNTIVCVQSDHGHSVENRTFGGGGSAGPYRGCKFSLFEGGIRVVSMITFPGTLAQGSVRGQLVTGCDWVPTLCELTGAPLPQRRIDGKSMVPVIHSATAPTQHPVFHWQLNDQWAAREGDWKLIHHPQDPTHKGPLPPEDKLFLSNLGEDVSERTNLAAKHPDRVRKLTEMHEQWARDVKDTS